MKRGTDLRNILRPLSCTTNQAYLSDALQVADLLEWILNQFGESEVWMTSFSISEEFLRRLYFIRQTGKVMRFNLVLDHKATNKTVNLWTFIENVIDRAYLSDNHSKLLLARSKDGRSVSVVTSQNLTRGNRAESAFISTDSQIFYSLLNRISELIDNYSVSLHDLLRTTTERN